MKSLFTIYTSKFTNLYFSVNIPLVAQEAPGLIYRMHKVTFPPARTEQKSITNLKVKKIANSK